MSDSAIADLRELLEGSEDSSLAVSLFGTAGAIATARALVEIGEKLVYVEQMVSGIEDRGGCSYGAYD